MSQAFSAFEKPPNRTFFKFLKKNPLFTDIEKVGRIVPLPNHYISDMPQGAWAGGFTGLFLCPSYGN
jgi:hypothetical protein